MDLMIVDDDPKFRGFMQRGLTETGHTCISAGDVEQAKRIIEEGPARDLILLDVMMPGQSGWDFLSWLRERGDSTPVIFVTARQAVDERVKGLQLGADDYIIKPFEFSELVARVEAVSRRHCEKRILAVADLRIDLEKHSAERDGQTIEMTPREYAVLLQLAEAKGHVVARESLLEHVWGIDFDPGTNVVNVLIARLRKKIDLPDLPALIHTVVGEGYILGEGREP